MQVPVAAPPGALRNRPAADPPRPEPIDLTRCRETTAGTRRPAVSQHLCQRPGCPTSKEVGRARVGRPASAQSDARSPPKGVAEVAYALSADNWPTQSI